MTDKLTAHKAWAAAGTTALGVFLAILGFGEMPAEADIVAAIKTAAMVAGSAAASFAATWLKRNYPK